MLGWAQEDCLHGPVFLVFLLCSSCVPLVFLLSYCCLTLVFLLSSSCLTLVLLLSEDRLLLFSGSCHNGRPIGWILLLLWVLGTDLVFHDGERKTSGSSVHQNFWPRKQPGEELTRKEGFLAWSILLFGSTHTTPTWDCCTGGMEWNGMEWKGRLYSHLMEALNSTEFPGLEIWKSSTSLSEECEWSKKFHHDLSVSQLRSSPLMT